MVDKEKKEKAERIAENKKQPERTRQDKQPNMKWGHIIDKDSYSNGPGENIYVFG